MEHDDVGQIATTNPGFKLDLARVLTAFKTMGDLGFPAFKKVWKQLNLSDIHLLPCADKTAYIRHMQECFSSILGLLHEHPSDDMWCTSVVYSLFLLHGTQLYEPKVKIRITKRT